MRNNVNLFYRCVPTKGILVRPNKIELSNLLNGEPQWRTLISSRWIYQRTNSSLGL